MALTNNHPLLKEVVVYAVTPSVGTSPQAAVTRSPVRGTVVKVGCVVGGAFTGTLSHAVKIIPATADGSAPGSGTTITGSPFTQSNTNSALGSSNFFIPSGANAINEDDLITFTPSGGTAATTLATYYAVIQMG